LFNLAIIWENNSLETLLLFRYLTGFFLAGIYPVGMKIAADYYQKGLGKSLGYLVGALVLGTAFPHLARDLFGGFNWKMVVFSTTSIAIAGGFLLFLLVPNGPFRKPGQKLDFSTIFKVFRNINLRAAAFGYFGHMWELYAFWAFIPLMLWSYSEVHTETVFNIPLISFLVIAVGGLGCVIGGYLSLRYGSELVAASALALSGLCCLVSPLGFQVSSEFFVAFLLFWGLMVTADSPLFSTLVASNAKPEIRGTALTIVNCIGFSITIVGIQTINLLGRHFNEK
jgi:MFS family permease